MADAAVKAVGLIKRTLPNGICPTGAARAGWQDLHDRNHRARQDSSSGAIIHGRIRPVKPSSVAGFVQRDPSNMAGFVQRDPSSVARFARHA